MKKLLLTVAAIVVIAIGFAYARPITVLHAVRDVKLWQSGFHSESAIVDGRHVHYFERGSGSTPLVLVHGLAMEAADWSPLLPYFGADHHVIAIDLPGFGASDAPDDYSIRAQSIALQHFLDAKQIARADVVGVSMGGWVAGLLAANAPQRVDKLVLVDSAGLNFETDLNENTFDPQTSADVDRLLALQSPRARHVPAFLARDVIRFVRPHARTTRLTWRAMITRRDVLDARLHDIDMPVLLVWGTADRITPYALGQRMQRELPHAQLVPLAGCGHIAILECRDRAFSAIDRFLAAH